MSASVIYASDTPLSPSNQLGISVPVSLSDKRQSFQINYDLGNNVNYAIQVTNIEFALDQYSAKVYQQTRRDDTYNSPMWITVETGMLTNVSTSGTELIFYPEPAAEYARVVLTYSSSSSQSNIVVLAQASEAA